MSPLRQVHHFFEQPIEAIANKDPLVHRLDVDVARPAGDGAVHDEIDGIDDRRGVVCVP